MSGTRSPDPAPRVEVFGSLDALPTEAAPLFNGRGGFFATRAWWETVLTHAMPPGSTARLLLIRDAGAAVALFPMVQEAGGLRALTTPYSCLYEPPILGPRAVAFAAVARFCRGFPTVRLDALDDGTEADLTTAGHAAGLAVARFEHFGNWHEDVTGLDWPGYLARRPGALRETIRRRTRRAERLAGAKIELFRDRSDIETGIAAFEAVYARSWKVPEPFPLFNPAQIRAAAGLDMARLAVWSLDGAAAAVQFWIVENGRATVLKLAHDEAFKAHSPGTVLTAWTIRHLIENERVTELDFGRGDDAYKQDWVASRRRRGGVLLIDPRKPAGMFAFGRHALGRLKARLL